MEISGLWPNDQTYPSHQKSFFFFLLTTAVKLAE